MKKISAYNRIYTKKTAFVNRSKELVYLSQWITKEPEYILFIYGPKSSGKTSLLMKFIENQVDKKIYSIKHFNLREMLISNYSDFIQAFFEVDYSQSVGDVKQKKEYNLKLFKLSNEIKKSLENKSLDPFVVMKKELQKINKKGKHPVIIIDEIQALEDIYMNGQRELLKELFNFFVSITKESHLCHVLIASSDGYFMNKLYNDSKLTKTTAFFEVDYLPEKDIYYWLTHLEQESSITAYTLSEDQISLIWKYLGGSMWEISYVLGELIPMEKNKRIDTQELKKEINRLIAINEGKLDYYAQVNKSKRALLHNILSVHQKTKAFKISSCETLIDKKLYNEKTLADELNHLVQINILAFNPTTAMYTIQGRSMFYGLQKYVENSKISI